MHDDPAEPKPDCVNPFLPPQVRSALPSSNDSAGVQISIADLLFCMLTIGLALTVEYQHWGGFGSTAPAYWVSALLSALSASLFFTANRLRRQSAIPFAQSPPGYNVALAAAGLLAASVFQYLVSFLDVRHVGPPIHILSLLSPMHYAIAVCGAVFYYCQLATRWRAYFLITAVYHLLRLGGYLCADLGSPNNLEDPYRLAAGLLFKASAAAWTLNLAFLLYAYVFDFITRERRDLLHHLGVILGLLTTTASALEARYFTQFYWYIYYELIPQMF